MKILFAFGFIPVPVFYLENLFTGGFSPCVFILMKAKYRDDKGLHIHELNHIEQAYKMGLIPFALLYWLNLNFRFKVEVDSYRKQIAFYGNNNIEFAVKLLMNDYGLHKTEKEVRDALTK